MNPCCEHLFREAKREIEIRDKRIKELQDECTRLFEPTREFWNKERASVLIEALEVISERTLEYSNPPIMTSDAIMAIKALKKYRGEI